MKRIQNIIFIILIVIALLLIVFGCVFLLNNKNNSNDDSLKEDITGDEVNEEIRYEYNYDYAYSYAIDNYGGNGKKIEVEEDGEYFNIIVSDSVGDVLNTYYMDRNTGKIDEDRYPIIIVN